MALDFPNTPTVGSTFTSGGTSWVWDGTKWKQGPQTPSLVTMSATPPSSPTPGTLWYDTNGGLLYCYYNDGNSSQWVIANPNSSGMVGPQGVIGPTGGTGPVGPTGPTGLSWPAQGVTDGSNAAAGVIGEYQQIISPSLNGNTSGSWYLATDVILSAGDWDLEAMAYSVLSSGSITNFAIMLSTNTSPGTGWPPASNPFSGAQLNTTGSATMGNNSLFTGISRWSVSASTTVWLHWLCAGGSPVFSQTYAAIRARRVR